jgi:tetratricopeptide (TPR) repeat protein
MTESDTNNLPPQQEPGTAQPQFGLKDQQAYAQYQQRTQKILWGVFGLLLLLAVGVIFLLPNLVAPPETAARIVVAESSAQGRAPVTSLSPFEEAQRLRQREAAQNTLAELLKLQEVLEKLSVEQWGAEEFAAAIEFARQGDSAYREQRFTDANDMYQRGVGILQSLDGSQTQRYQDYVATGNRELERGAAAAADEAFDMALLLQPGGTEAVRGKQRAAVLNDVLAFLEEGKTLHQGGDFDTAKNKYQQALALDSAHPEATAALQQVNRDIEQRAYSQAMSRGYAALQANDAAGAEISFLEAQRMRPTAEEVKVALQQAKDQASTQVINRHMEAARSFEAGEQWSAAVEQWEAAVAVDPNLVVADRGLRRTRTRLELDVFFSRVLEDPLSLVAEDIHAQTQQLLIDIQQISNPGPRLREQIASVSAMMDKARVPVPVTLQSDGLTAVNVYRVGEQGVLTSRTLDLLPGNYVVVGSRSGYRDVRVEFTVNIGVDAVGPISVICNERI